MVVTETFTVTAGGGVKAGGACVGGVELSGEAAGLAVCCARGLTSPTTDTGPVPVRVRCSGDASRDWCGLKRGRGLEVPLLVGGATGFGAVHPPLPRSTCAELTDCTRTGPVGAKVAGGGGVHSRLPISLGSSRLVLFLRGALYKRLPVLLGSSREAGGGGW